MSFQFTLTHLLIYSGVILAVQNALVQQGIPDLSSGREVVDGDGNTKTVYDRNLIEPGKVNIGVSMLYDTVSSGVGNLYNMAVPSQVQQTLHLTQPTNIAPFSR